MIRSGDAIDQEQEQKIKHVSDVLMQAISDAREAGIFGEVQVTVKMQNGRIGHYEKVVRETYK